MNLMHPSDDTNYIPSDHPNELSDDSFEASLEADQPQASLEDVTLNIFNPLILPEGTRRATNKPKRLNDYYCSFATSLGQSKATSYLTYKRLSTSHIDILDKVSTSVEPKSFTEASDNPLWVQVMKEELAALELNQTWDIVEKP